MQTWAHETAAVPEAEFLAEVPYASNFPTGESLTEEEVALLRRLAPEAFKRGTRGAEKDRALAAYERVLVSAILRQVRPTRIAEQLGDGFSVPQLATHAKDAWRRYVDEEMPEGDVVPVPAAEAGMPRDEARARGGTAPLESLNVHDRSWEREQGSSS